MPESAARFVDVGGIRTRYFEKGRGEPLLLVHGGQPSSMDGTAWDWQQNFDALAGHFHVYALDRIGQGYTANPANLDDYANYYRLVVEHLRAFIRAMGLTRVHLVGHSQGSWPVTRIALDDPALVASLTLVDGTMVAPPRDDGSAVRFYLYLTQDLHPRDGETLESARRGMELFSYTRNNITAQRVERLLAMTRQDKFAASQAWFAKSGMSPAHPVFRALKQQVIAELGAGRLHVPVLVVWGANDPEGSLASGLELFRMVSASSPRPRLHVFGRSGHLSFVEYPEEFNRVLTDFVLDVPPTERVQP
jgi:2-hydroxy-6-oxo-6-(2'-carboxyphenyl)-hexa-2,4-dienoate hydrolase